MTSFSSTVLRMSSVRRDGDFRHHSLTDLG
jgi:hypothetical protein